MQLQNIAERECVNEEPHHSTAYGPPSRLVVVFSLQMSLSESSITAEMLYRADSTGMLIK